MTPREPARVASAPARVNLLGEQVDHQGGTVLPVAVGLRTTVRYTPGESWEFESQDHPPGGEWTRYPQAVIDLLTEERHPIQPGHLAIESTIPEARGLASSAALEVALAGALLGETAPFEIARLCRRAENEKIKVPCGLMDQAVAACAIAGHAMVLDCSRETFFHIPLPKMELLLVDPGIPRELGATEYPQRRAEAEQKDTPAAQHVAAEQERVERGIELLDAGDAAGFGRLMSESHRSLRDLYRCSHPLLDRWVEYLENCPGVHGARMVGGGWGGCVIAVAQPGTRVEQATNLVSDDGLSTVA